MYMIFTLSEAKGFFDFMSFIAGAITFLGVLAFILTGIFSKMGDKDAGDFKDAVKKPLIIVSASFVILSVVCMAMPSKETLAYIVGGYAVTNTEEIEKLPSNITKAANKFLEDFYEEDE